MNSNNSNGIKIVSDGNKNSNNSDGYDGNSNN